VVALASVVSAKLLTEWLRRGAPSGPPPAGLIGLAIGLTLLLGLVIGLFHAFMINQLRLPPFIATLATMAGLRSMATVLSQNRTINVSFDWYRVWGSDSRYALVIFGCVAVSLSVLMGCTVLGRHLFALGGNETAARLSGLRTRRLKAVAYGLSGTLSALGGILFTGLSGQADSRLGVTYELTAITAAVVGGCSLAGGVGSIRGTVLGLLLTQIVIKGTGTVVRGIDSTQIEGLVLGTVVVLAVAFNQQFRGRRE
jgi:ribose/xylose/arabinose/galactoside ABC-type transport system permease subunit